MALSTGRLEALRASNERLRGIVGALDPAQLDASAYPTEWTVADVLSHLGSGAVIFGGRLADALAGRETGDDFAQSVWDEWNAKASDARASDALVADAALMAAVDAMTQEQRDSYKQSFGPLEVDLDAAIGLRLNEHAMHTWDIEVTFDPTATVPPTSTEQVIDTVTIIARFVGKPTGTTRDVRVRTTDPARDFSIALGEAVTFAPADSTGEPDLVLSAEALDRLVYGRLDPAHTPAFEGDATALDDLRAAFRGL